jgi:hypothetical protein
LSGINLGVGHVSLSDAAAAGGVVLDGDHRWLFRKKRWARCPSALVRAGLADGKDA